MRAHDSHTAVVARGETDLSGRSMPLQEGGSTGGVMPPNERAQLLGTWRADPRGGIRQS